MTDKTTHPLLKRKFGIIPITEYRGIILEKLKDGYKVFGQKVSTPQEVDVLIDNACETIKKSII